jgi:hypothetical protein
MERMEKMSKYFVLFVRRYDFSDETGKRIQGFKVTYLDEQIENTATAKGRPPMTVTSSETGMWHAFSTVPGYYDLNFRMRPDAKGKPMLVLQGAKLVPEEKAQEQGREAA